MSKFKHRDAVFCPALTTKQLLVQVVSSSNGMILNHRGNPYWHNLDGVFDTNNTPYQRLYKNLPSVFLATEENRVMLESLYDLELDSSTDVKIYAVNVLDSSGSASSDWVYGFRGGYYSLDMSGNGCGVDSFREYGILMSPFAEDLEKALDDTPFGRIICIGSDDINNWANGVDLDE